MNLDGTNILVTGGTGSFGKQFIRRLLKDYNPERIIILSRDELKQFQLRQEFPITDYPNVRMFIGDIRDRDRIHRVMEGVDIVVHAAALKQVPTAEFNPLEVIKTNILGSANIIDAAFDHKVSKVIALSTDKAANPINLYGATKLCADKLFVAANGTGLYETKFSVVRHGNVVGSRGSVIPYFLAQRSTGRLTITDLRMTRFLVTLEKAVDFVLSSLNLMLGGEIFVPKIPSVEVAHLADIIAPECEQQIIGIRPGEKLHESMIPEDDARLTIEFEEYYVIQPSHSYWNPKDFLYDQSGKPCAEDFKYSSDTNTWWLDDEEIVQMVKMVEAEMSASDLPMASEPRFIVGG